MDFGVYFRELRLNSGQTLRNFCKNHGCNPSNISKLERGVLPPPKSKEKLMKYAKALGINNRSQAYSRLCALSKPPFNSASIISEREFVQMLPMHLTCAGGERFPQEQLGKLIALIKRDSGKTVSKNFDREIL